MRITVDYDQVSQLVQQLPLKDRDRLFSENGYFTPPSELPEPIIPSKEYCEMLLNFPVISEEEVEQILEAKRGIDKCRSVSL